jgi:iron(II)-dependent oxidoreductase
VGTNPAQYRSAGADEIPQHVLSLPEYRIMRYSVTNGQFRAFVEATDHHPVPLTWRKGYPVSCDDHPVTGDF